MTEIEYLNIYREPYFLIQRRDNSFRIVKELFVSEKSIKSNDLNEEILTLGNNLQSYETSLELLVKIDKKLTNRASCLVSPLKEAAIIGKYECVTFKKTEKGHYGILVFDDSTYEYYSVTPVFFNRFPEVIVE